MYDSRSRRRKLALNSAWKCLHVTSCSCKGVDEYMYRALRIYIYICVCVCVCVSSIKREIWEVFNVLHVFQILALGRIFSSENKKTSLKTNFEEYRRCCNCKIPCFAYKYQNKDLSLHCVMKLWLRFNIFTARWIVKLTSRNQAAH